MANEDKLNINSVAVQTHITAVQAIINRMASNCASCKTWCITLVSAILVIGFDKEKGNPKYFLIASIPVILFFILDAFYLSLEKILRKSHEDFVGELTETTIDDTKIKKSIFSFSNNKPRKKGQTKEGVKNIFKAMLSVSVLPFYFLQFVMLVFTYCLITK